MVAWFSGTTIIPDESGTIWKKIHVLMLEDNFLSLDLFHVFMLMLPDPSIVFHKVQIPEVHRGMAE